MIVNFSNDDYALLCKLAHAQRRWPAAMVHDVVMAWARGVERRTLQGTVQGRASWQGSAPTTRPAPPTAASPTTAARAPKVP